MDENSEDSEERIEKKTKEVKIGTQKASPMKKQKVDRVFLKSNNVTQEKNLLSNKFRELKKEDKITSRKTDQRRRRK